MFKKITQKLKNRLSFVTDKELYEALGMTKSRFNGRKGLNSIPYEEIIILCIKRDISLDWLFDNKITDGAGASTSINNLNSGVSVSNGAITGDIHFNGGEKIITTLNPDDFAAPQTAAEVVENLKYCPKPFIDELHNKVQAFKTIAKRGISPRPKPKPRKKSD
ncbi:MAG: helix-turn-helix domain containing protein [Helicobacteraceae bacterium]|jgi:hypothetical protein|nr:helix-turn-helix domain containing protein [Helicobacteraceae bacterium]